MPRRARLDARPACPDLAGPRPELVGGGLIRSQGGWSLVISMRRHGSKGLSDERVLGSGDFNCEQID